MKKEKNGTAQVKFVFIISLILLVFLFVTQFMTSASNDTPTVYEEDKETQINDDIGESNLIEIKE